MTALTARPTPAPRLTQPDVAGFPRMVGGALTVGFSLWLLTSLLTVLAMVLNTGLATLGVVIAPVLTTNRKDRT